MDFDEATVKRVIRPIDFNEYKRRQSAPGLKVTSKAFGVGRRIPIAQKYQIVGGGARIGVVEWWVVDY